MKTAIQLLLFVCLHGVGWAAKSGTQNSEEAAGKISDKQTSKGIGLLHRPYIRFYQPIKKKEKSLERKKRSLPEPLLNDDRGRSEKTSDRVSNVQERSSKIGKTNILKKLWLLTELDQIQRSILEDGFIKQKDVSNSADGFIKQKDGLKKQKDGLMKQKYGLIKQKDGFKKQKYVSNSAAVVDDMKLQSEKVKLTSSRQTQASVQEARVKKNLPLDRLLDRLVHSLLLTSLSAKEDEKATPKIIDSFNEYTLNRAEKDKKSPSTQRRKDTSTEQGRHVSIEQSRYSSFEQGRHNSAEQKRHSSAGQSRQSSAEQEAETAKEIEYLVSILSGHKRSSVKVNDQDTKNNKHVSSPWLHVIAEEQGDRKAVTRKRGEEVLVVQKQNAQKQGSLKQDALKQNALKQDALNHDALKKDALKKDALRQYALRQDALKQDALKQDAMKQDALKKDALKRDALKQDAIKQDALKQDALKQDALNHDALKKDALKEDALRQYTLRRDALKQDALRLKEKKNAEQIRRTKMRDAQAIKHDVLHVENNKKGGQIENYSYASFVNDIIDLLSKANK